MSADTIETPCIGVCTLMPQTGSQSADGPSDPRGDLCLGCGRTRTEIAAWTRYSPAERTHIMAGLHTRLEGLHDRLKSAAKRLADRDPDV